MQDCHREVVRMRGVIVLLTILILSGCALPWDHSWVADLVINDIDLSTRPDGLYQGSFMYNRFEYRVEVTIEDHQIRAIQVLDNRATHRAQMAEEVIGRVLEGQSLRVDMIAGASNTSKALLKAIEDALSS